MLVLFLLILLALCLWLAFKDFLYPIWYRFQAYWHGCGVPVFVWYWPIGIPFARDMMKFAKEDQLLDAVKELYLSIPDGKSTYMRQGLLVWVLATRDPENLKALLATNFASFSLGTRNPQLEPIFGSGIFTQDGNQWKHSRAMLRPQFSKEQISRLSSIERHIDTLISHITDKPIELQEMFHLLTMDTATEFLFGKSVDSLKFSSNSRGVLVVDEASGDKVWSADFVESYTFLNELAFKRLVLNGLSWITRFTDPESAFHLRRVHIFLDHYVQEALQATSKSKNSDNHPSEYVFSHELAKEERDPVRLRNQLFNILIAGRDTTASTLSFSIYYLTRYPSEWEKLRNEVTTMVPPGTPITYESLRRLKYTQNFIKEVMRLAPVVPLNVRSAIRDTTLPRGGGPDGSQPVFVPKGTDVNYSAYVLHRDPSIYGSDAEEFRPERWSSEERDKSSAMNAWGYIPFNGGPRICLGQQFALTEISLTLVKLAQTFVTLEPADNFPSDIIHRAFLTLQVGKPGVPVILKS